MADSRLEIIITARDRASRELRRIGTNFQRFQRTAGFGKFNQNLDKSTKAIKQSGDAAGTAGPKLAGLVRLFALLGGAAVLGTVVRSTVEFSKAIAEVSTLIDDAAITNDVLTQSVLELSAEFGTAPVQVAAGLYQAISAGAEAGAEANELLTVALKTAVGGVTSVEVAVDGLTTIINAFNLDTSQAEEVADALFTAMKGGKTTIEELSRSLFQGASSANLLGVSFQELLANVQVLTLSGVPTSVAFTQIRQAMVGIIRETPELALAFAEFGGSAKAAIQALGLAGAFQLVRDASNGSEGALIKLVGSVEALNAVVSLTDTGLSKVEQALEDINDSAGAAEIAFQKVSDSLGFQFDKAINKSRVSFIELGNAIAPVILGIANGIAFAAAALQRFITLIVVSSRGTGDLADEGARVADAFKVILDQLALLIGDIFSAGEETSVWLIIVRAIERLFQGVALIIAAIRDGISAIKIIIAGVGLFIGRFLIRPLAEAARQAARLASIVNNDLAEALQGAADDLTKLADESEESFDRQVAAFTEGGSALQNTLERLAFGPVVKAQVDKAGVELDKLAPKVAKAGEDASVALVKAFDPATAIEGNLKAIATVTAAEVSSAIVALEREFEKGLISAEAFTRRRLTLQQSVIDAQIEALTEEAKATKELTKQATIGAQILVLERQRRDLQVEATRDQVEANRDLRNALNQVRVELAETMGIEIPIELQQELIIEEFRVLRARLVAAGRETGVELVDALIDTRVLRTKFEAVFQQIRQLQENLARQTQLITDRQTAGLISQFDAQLQITQLNKEQLPQLERLREAASGFAAALKDPAAIQAVRDLDLEIKALAATSNVFSAAFKQAFTDSFAQGLIDVATGVKGLDEALKDLVRSIADAIAKIAAQQIAQAAFGAAAGAFGGGGGSGFGAIAAQVFAGARGGKVTGAGTSTSDSIPARLSTGEFVMRASAVKHFGAGFFESLNRGKMGSSFPISVPTFKFAKGGIAIPVIPGSTEPGGETRGLRIINTIDPALVSGFLTSSEGEKIILNVLGRNPSNVKSILNRS